MGRYWVPPPTPILSLTAIREARKHSILWPYKDIRGIAPLALHPTLLCSPSLRDLSCFWFPLIDNSLMPALESLLPKRKTTLLLFIESLMESCQPSAHPLATVLKPVHLLTLVALNSFRSLILCRLMRVFANCLLKEALCHSVTCADTNLAVFDTCPSVSEYYE